MSDENKQIAKGDYAYYAFISYSRKDEMWAKWLQSKLETYRLPTALRKNNESIPKRITPVFRDKTDLSGGVLQDVLYKELESSQYLIVICSPNSVASEWVNKEIEYFITTGRQENVIPFVVDDVPFSEKPSQACYPKALQEMPHELLGINVKELGKNMAFLRVVATLLNLKFDQIVMRDKKRKVRNGIIFAVFAAIVLTGMAWFIWYNIPHVKYYNSYVYENEVPEGISELSAAQRKSAYRSYKITKQRGKVIRLECVNAFGTVVEPVISYATNDYPAMEFQYDDAGELTAVTLKDVNGEVVLQKSLTYNVQTNQIAIDFHAPSNATQAQALASNILYSDVSQMEAKSEITRYYNTYDEDSRLIRSMFQRDNLGTHTCDANGVYGRQYEYNDLGQIIRIDNLDHRGNVYNCKYGWATIVYTYDEMGNVLKEQYLDSQGQQVRNEQSICSYVYTYDAYGNILQIEAFDELDHPCNTSEYIAMQVFTYDSNGLLTSIKMYNAEGLPVYNAAKVHEVRYSHDEKGRVCEISYYGIDGEYAFSATERCVRIVKELDEAGHILLLRQYDAEGNLTRHHENGAYQNRYVYDENGYLCGVYAMDADGKPMTTNEGISSFIQQRDTNGRIQKVSCFDTEGNPCMNNLHMASFEYEYDTFGNIIQVRYYDEQGNPCISNEGIAGFNQVYEDGNIVSATYFDIYGEPAMCSSYYHEWRAEYDDRGNQIRVTYHDLDGNLIDTINQYAIEEWDYDVYGNITSFSWYNKNHQYQVRKDKDYYKITKEYDARGNVIEEHYETFDYIKRTIYTARFEWNAYDQMIQETYYDQDGNLLRSDEIATIHIGERDDKGNLISRLLLDADGMPYLYDDPAYYNVYRYEFDGKGNVILEHWIHKDAQGVEACLYQIRYQRDSAGNVVRSDFLDAQGNLVNGEDGFSTQIAAYDSRGKIVDEEYYDQNGERCLRNFCWKVQRVYDVQGNCIEERRYDVNGELLREADGAAAVIRYEYNAQGKNTYIAYFNENDQMYNAGENVTVAMDIIYDPMGNEIERVHYNSAGTIRWREAYYAWANPVFEGGTAHAAGMQTGDILISYGSWNYFDEKNMFHNLMGTITNYQSREKELVICRTDENGIIQFIRFLLPEGSVGVKIQTTMGQREVIENIQNAYNQWLRGSLF